VKADLRIPQDIAFAHLSLPSIFSNRKLSGLDQNWGLAGAAAVDSVVAQIHRNERGIPDIPKTLMVEGRWIEGETAPGMLKTPVSCFTRKRTAPLLPGRCFANRGEYLKLCPRFFPI